MFLPTVSNHPVPAWWKESSVYQIYPASFQDSTGSGYGDLPGIIDQVDYITELGVNVVWLSPIFESPQVDMGYDISDYRKVDTRYGSIEDVDTLRDKLHKRGIKLVLDLVVNHTSDQHEWFNKSRSSTDNPYRNWYIWRKPRYDSEGNPHPPNNWESHFSGSAWEYDPATDEYYLHLFSKAQPDLNWEHPAVRSAVHEIMRFWLDRGIDGFRLDVINFISKDPSFPDSVETVLKGHEFYAAGPRLHEYLKDLGTILHAYDAFSVGEMPCVTDTAEIIKSVRGDRGELSMIFHFDFVTIDYGRLGKYSPKEWTLAELKSLVNKWQRFMYDNQGWNALYIENHDQPRSISRFACDCEKHRVDSGKMLAAFIGLQSGTPFVYQGQELGMINVPKDWSLEEYRDVEIWNHWKEHEDASPEEKKEIMDQYQKKGRDNSRTPMQWNASAHAGFTSQKVHPWINANPSYKQINAVSQLPDPNSVFAFWKKVLHLRREYKDIFVYGDFSLEDDADPLLVYKRYGHGREAYVVCSFAKEGEVEWKGLKKGVNGRVLVGSAKKGEIQGGEKVRVAPYETLVVLVERRRMSSSIDAKSPTRFSMDARSPNRYSIDASTPHRYSSIDASSPTRYSMDARSPTRFR